MLGDNLRQLYESSQEHWIDMWFSEYEKNIREACMESIQKLGKKSCELSITYCYFHCPSDMSGEDVINTIENYLINKQGFTTATLNFVYWDDVACKDVYTSDITNELLIYLEW